MSRRRASPYDFNMWFASKEDEGTATRVNDLRAASPNHDVPLAVYLSYFNLALFMPGSNEILVAGRKPWPKASLGHKGSRSLGRLAGVRSPCDTSVPRMV